MLEEGGEVIFAGRVPSYVNAESSSEVLELASIAKRVPFMRNCITRACAGVTEITAGREAQRDILARSYWDGNDRKVMLLNKNWGLSTGMFPSAWERGRVPFAGMQEVDRCIR